MPLGLSLLLIAAGAIMKWAVSVNGDGFNINTIGVILMVVGAIGLLISLFLFNPWVERDDGRGRVVERDREVLR
jgi:hypothetical protein